MWILALLAAAASGPLDDLPRLLPDVQAHYVSSYDRSGGNDDGFDGTYSALYVDENGEHVIFDVKGPGTLYNLWFTSRVDGRSPLGWGRIRFYFDDEETARIDMDADELFSGRHPPFVPPFVYHNFQSTGGYVTCLPFPFQKRLEITTENRVGFYNAYYHTYAPDRPVETWRGEEDMRRLERFWLRADRPRGELHSGKLSLDRPAMPDGEPVPARGTVFEQEGAGVVTSLRFDPLFPLTAYELEHIILEISWDGQTEPSVRTPLGSFFGSGLGEASVRSALVTMSPSGSYEARFPMPFWESARIALVNENPKPTPEIYWEVTVAPNAYPPEETGYFHARYRREWPTTTGRDYEILRVAGSGVYLGQVMTVEPMRPELKRWWEGDLKIFLDGRLGAAFHGTGHEDEYLGGWSNEWLMNPYSLPMHGEPKTTELRQVDFQWSAATTVYRFFMQGIPFQSGIEVLTEHGNENTANALYSSVAYFYARPASMERLGVAEAGSARLTFDVPPGYRHLRLRRRYDRTAIQEAEVWIGGHRRGVWYDASANPYEKAIESDFLLPEAPAGSKRKLEIEIRPLRPGWNASRYELWGMK